MSVTVFVILFLCISCTFYVTAVNPFIQNITVYHVNPAEYGANPLNMDTGNVIGDMFFDMSWVVMYPLACPNGTATEFGFDCSNPEAAASDLVVNQVILEVDTRFSEYAMCNIGVNNTDGMGHFCKNNTYCCFCPGEHFNQSVPCNATLGQESIERFARWTCQANETIDRCYRDNLIKKFGDDNPGYWYSSLTDYYCPSGEWSPTCTWRLVSREKVVEKTCHNSIFYGAVELAGQECFNNCGVDVKNSSSPCWVNCFFSTVLGPEGGLPNGTITGMPVEALVDAWTKPFADEKDGGCPAI